MPILIMGSAVSTVYMRLLAESKKSPYQFSITQSLADIDNGLGYKERQQLLASIPERSEMLDRVLAAIKGQPT